MITVPSGFININNCIRNGKPLAFIWVFNLCCLSSKSLHTFAMGNLAIICYNICRLYVGVSLRAGHGL